MVAVALCANTTIVIIFSFSLLEEMMNMCKCMWGIREDSQYCAYRYRTPSDLCPPQTLALLAARAPEAQAARWCVPSECPGRLGP